MPEVHICPVLNKSGILGAKTSILMSVQDCSCLPSPKKCYSNTTPRYLGWFKSLDHLPMLIDWDKPLSREDSHSKQWIRSSTYVRHSSHEQETYSGCGEPQWTRLKHVWEFGELERDTHVWASELGPPIQQEHNGVWNVTLMVLYCLENFLQKMGGNHVANHARGSLCKTKQWLHALVLAWHGSPPQALAGERDPCQLQNQGCNTFLRETQDGSWLLLTATWTGPGLWHTSTLHFSSWPTPGSFLLRKSILKLFPRQWSWTMLCSSQLHTEPGGVRGAAFHAVSQGYEPSCHRKKSAAVLVDPPQIDRIFKHLIHWSISTAS